MSLSSRVIFFQVYSPKQKILKLVEIARQHFLKKEPLLIFVEDEKAQKFVDELLWKLPDTSFLPHVASDQKTKDFLVITKQKINFNEAKIAFNLCPTPLLIDPPFKILYDFEDHTNLSKKKFSSLRFDAYKKENFLIEAL